MGVPTGSCMRVELPQLLTVLAHEVRTPLGILQGYIRLLQRRPGLADADAAMLQAMLDATGRIASIGRDAASLAGWLESAALPLRPVALSALRAEIARHVPETLTIHDAGTAGTSHVLSNDLARLASAIVTVAQVVARGAGTSALTLEATACADPPVARLTLRPAGLDTPPDARADARAEPLAFDQGGMGLALVSASCVFDAHGARVTTTDGTATIELRGGPDEP